MIRHRVWPCGRTKIPAMNALYALAATLFTVWRARNPTNETTGRLAGGY